MAEDKVIVGLELNKSDLKKIDSETTKTFSKAGEDSGAAFTSKFGSAAKVAIVAAVGTLGLFTKNAVSAASKLEDINVQFTTFLKSQQKAIALTDQLNKFTASTPFQLEGVAASAKVLLAFGTNVEDITTKLRMLGDIAAGSGKPLKDLSVIYGQISGAGKLTGERLNQLQEAGVNVVPALSKVTGILGKDIRDAVSKSQISFQDVEKALVSLTSAGGLFEGGMKRLSNTLTGRISTLKDNFFLLSAAIGKYLLPVLKQGAAALSEWLNGIASNEQAIKGFMQGLITFGTVLNNFVIAPLQLLWNTSKVIFNLLQTGIQVVVSSIASGVSTIVGILPDSIIPDGWKEGLNDFKEASQETLEDFNTDTQESLAAIYDGGLFTGLSIFLEESRVAVEGSNALLTESVKKTTEALKTTGKVAVKTSKEIGKAVSGALAKGISSGIQTIVNSIAAGENAFAAFAKNTLNVIGEMAIQLGEMFILKGIAIDSFKSLSGGAAIAAGIALIALGSIAKSYSGGGGATAGAATGGGGGIATYSEQETISDETIDEQEDKGPRITVNIQGDVLDSEESGLKIIELINQSVDDSSVSIRRGAIA